MTLPSQFARPTSRHNYMFRRRRRGRRAFLIVLCGLLVVALGVWAMRGDDEGPSSTLASSEHYLDEVHDEPAMTNPLANADDFRRSTPRQPERNEIRMGGTVPPADDRAPATAAQEIASRESAAPSATESPEPEPQPEQRVATPPAASTPTSRPSSNPGRERALERMRVGMDMLASNRPIEARRMLTQALDSQGMDETNARQIRETLTELNERLVFSPEVVEGDPFAFGYTIRPGDALSRLPRSQNVAADWRLIQRINRISRPASIRAGQHIKLITGPFHAVVHKQQYRMDVYMGDEGNRVYVRSFPVGLGEYGSTPVGTFRVRPNSKLINPEWVNPRTGERFLPDDPMNPIGEHWIGLDGVSEGIRGLGGYGIHGTIEPESIGRQASMGCIRMHAEDVELVYELLVEDRSIIEIIDR